MAYTKKIKKSDKKLRFSKYRVTKLQLLIVVAIFAVLGAVFLIFSKAAAPTTVLTVHATDGVNSHAICINNTMTVASGATTKGLAGCLQTNDPTNPTSVRFGFYDLTLLEFTPKTGWITSTLPSSLLNVATLTCATSGDVFYGIGPVAGVYYGEEKMSSTTLRFGSYTASTKACSGYTANHSYSGSTWATPTITCPASALKETDINQLRADIASNKATVYCLAPGKYVLTSPIALAGNGIQIIGDPIFRPDIDASGVKTSDGQRTSAIIGGGAINPTIANVIIHSAPTPGSATCGSCGHGVWTAPNTKIYNAYLYGNQETGVNGHSATIENSSITFNGNTNDIGNPTAGAAGVKFGETFVIKYSFIAANIGVGVWCDSSCRIATTPNVPSYPTTVVSKNYIVSNLVGGIRQEISATPATFSGNVVSNNVSWPALTAAQKLWHGGIEVISAQKVTATNNILTGNVNAGIISKTDPKRSAITNSNITIKNNVIGTQKVICDTGTAVVCTPNP